MNPQLILLLIEAVTNALGLVDSVALPGLDNAAELAVYIAKRDKIRHQLVEVSNSLTSPTKETSVAGPAAKGIEVHDSSTIVTKKETSSATPQQQG